jgi:hypothetical protein
MGKLDYDSFASLKESQPAAAAKLYNRIVRHQTFELIYSKKNDIELYKLHLQRPMDDLGLTDVDLLIDLRLGSSQDIQNVYKANAEKNIGISRVEMKEKR